MEKHAGRNAVKAQSPKNKSCALVAKLIQKEPDHLRH